MPNLHVESTLRLDDDGHGLLITIVTGHTQPDQQVIDRLAFTEGGAQNQVDWRPEGFYLVVGNYDPNPFRGDTIINIVERLERLVGKGKVSLRLRDPNNAAEDSAVPTRDDELPPPRLDTAAAVALLQMLDDRQPLEIQRYHTGLPAPVFPDNISDAALEALKSRLIQR